LAQSLSPVWSGRLALIASAALALLLAWLAIRLVWLIIVGPQVEPAPVPPIPRITQTATTSGDFRWDLFGPSQRSPMPLPTAVASAARSSLRLLGVMSGGSDSFAIIADNQGQENVFRLGDELPDGATLEAVEPQRVIIARDGRSEALELDRDRPGRTARSTARPSAGPAAVQVAPIPGLRGFEAPAGIGVASIPGMSSTGALNVGALSQSISVIPVSSGGFRVRPGRDARLFSELGLQINDVVTAVNGQPLESEQAARALFADVMRRGEVAITINRGGQEMTLRPDLEQVMRSLQNQ
jgi:general secretion pathway protein C